MIYWMEKIALDTPDYRDCSLHVYLLAGFAGRKKEE